MRLRLRPDWHLEMHQHSPIVSIPRKKQPTMPGPLSLFSVNAVLVMSADDGSRIFSKYYSAPHPPAGAAPNSTDYPGANPYPTVKEQRAFEKGLLDKTNKSTNDVILYDNRIVVFKLETDVMLYVVGSAEENEVLLYNVVLSLRDALGILFKYVLSFMACEFWNCVTGINDLLQQRCHGQTVYCRELRPGKSHVLFCLGIILIYPIQGLPHHRRDH